LDCGGRAQRRHRFPHGQLRPKAAWRFASRRSPKNWLQICRAGPFMPFLVAKILRISRLFSVSLAGFQFV
jgi:hypothetical protein